MTNDLDSPVAATAPGPSKRKVALLSAAGLAIAAAIGVMFVLPAEFGIDPTGVGKATGLVEIGQPARVTPELRRGQLRTGVLTVAEGDQAVEPGRADHYEIELAPYDSIELKYVLDEGAAISFHWRATGPVAFDMHGHPFEGGTALTESYAIDTAPAMQGRYVAPFTGIHGWFWQNRTMQPVTLTLDASGAITASKIFDSSGEHERDLVSQ